MPFRLLFAVLVLLNLFAWYWWSGEQRIAKQVVMGGEAPYSRAARLTLLSEAPQPEIAIEQLLVPEYEPRRVVQQEAVVAEPVIVVCKRLGPFAETGRLVLVESELDQISQQYRRISDSRVTARRYWVLLPPPTNESERISTIEKLKQLEVESFVVGVGEYSNHLSLGYFEGRENAENFRQNLTDLTSEAFIHPLETREVVYWVEVMLKNTEQDEALAELKRVEPGLVSSDCAELADRE